MSKSGQRKANCRHSFVDAWLSERLSAGSAFTKWPTDCFIPDGPEIGFNKEEANMFAITRILLPIDFSARSADAAAAATAVAGHFHSEITLLHVVPRHFETPIVLPGQSTVIPGAAQEEAEEKMREFWCEAWRHLEVQRVLREGDPARTIVEYADSEQFDLIMMPTHGYGPFRRLLLGSVTAKVLHDAKCPVWTAVHSQETPVHISAEPRRIAAAVDLEPYSSNVLRWAGRLSCEFGAPLSIIHVAPLDPRVEDDYLSPGWREKVISNDKAEVTGLMQIDGINGEIHIEVGSIPDAVIERTQNVQADLLVIGRSGHGGVTGRLPTNAYAIIRNSPCPVLAV